MGVYLNSNQKQVGPYEISQVNQMLASSKIDIETLGWQEGMGNWEPLSSPTFCSLGISMPKQRSIDSSNHKPRRQSKMSLTDNTTRNIKSEGRSFRIGCSISEAFAFFKLNPIGSIAWLVATGALSSTGVGLFLTPLVGVNFFACAKRFREQGQKMNIGELFDFSNAIEKILGPIVIGFMIGVGFLFLIIPGIVLSMWWTFSPCVLADRPELSFLEAMKESRFIAKGNWINLIILFVAIGFLQILGAICFGIGLLVTIPVGYLALYNAYDQCKRSG